MINNKFLKSITYIALTCSTPTFTTALAASNYTCPQPTLVAVATLAAIRQGLNRVIIQTNYGTLSAAIQNSETVKNELESNFLPVFQDASILFQNISVPAYDLECAYAQPDLTFYMHDTKLFIGTTDYYWYARGQGQEGPYAWCNGKGSGVTYCTFTDKPE